MIVNIRRLLFLIYISHPHLDAERFLFYAGIHSGQDACTEWLKFLTVVTNTETGGGNLH